MKILTLLNTAFFILYVFTVLNSLSCCVLDYDINIKKYNNQIISWSMNSNFSSFFPCFIDKLSHPSQRPQRIENSPPGLKPWWLIINFHILNFFWIFLEVLEIWISNSSLCHGNANQVSRPLSIVRLHSVLEIGKKCNENEFNCTSRLKSG